MPTEQGGWSSPAEVNKLALEPSISRELTHGEKAAGVTFNPGGNPLADSIKRKFAAIIDELNDERSKVKGEAARYYSKAISYAEDAQMNAVKAATWQH
jgi:hypothetical protein